jgi:tripartite-type tricarboxylate transporter receptor subunit TctC
MQMHVLKLVAALASAPLLLALPAAASAQPAPLPSLIKIIVPAAPGASADILARALAAQLGPRTGSTVIVENKPGGSTMIGSAAVAHGPKDGSMLLINSTSLLSTGATMREPPLDVVNDLAPVAMLTENPLVLAVSNNRADIRTPTDLIAAARKAPDRLTHGTTGVGTIAHVAMELLNGSAHIQIKHIPYKGTALAVNDLAGGVIDMVLATQSTVAPAVKSGRAHLVAVTSAEPSPAFPGVPTMASAAPGYKADLFVGVYAAAGTPAPVIQRLNREINEIAKSKALRDLSEADGGVPKAMTPEEFALHVRESYATWKKVATEKSIIAE